MYMRAVTYILNMVSADITDSLCGLILRFFSNMHLHSGDKINKEIDDQCAIHCLSVCFDLF